MFAQGFRRRRFAGGSPEELPPDCQRPAAGRSAGSPALLPPPIRRNGRRNFRASSGQMPGNCRTVSRHSPGRWSGSCRRDTGGHPAAIAAQLPGNLPSPFHLMPGTDANLIRQAAAQFQPRRRPRFQNLQPCREVIVELREKGASCEAIAELLTRYGVKTSRTMVNEFVHILCQPKEGRRRKALLKRGAPVVTPLPSSALPASVIKSMPTAPEPIPSAPVKTRGPHIAKVELLKPGEQYD